MVDSWEILVEEDRVKEFGGKIYKNEGSVECRMEELKGLMEVMEQYGMEVVRTPLDGNCFYHAVAEQTGMDHGEVRAAAVKYLKENDRMNGERWDEFIEGGRRGRRYYLRKMATAGE